MPYAGNALGIAALSFATVAALTNSENLAVTNGKKGERFMSAITGRISAPRLRNVTWL
jgi:hypothetical protein